MTESRQCKSTKLANVMLLAKPDLQPDDRVLIRDRNEEATVVRPAENAPRSVVVTTDSNTSYRRNTRMLDPLPPLRFL